MNTDILAIFIMLIITGIVITAWRIRATRDESNEGLKEPPVLSERAKKSQMQISIERVEEKQVQISKALDHILETISIERVEKKQVEISKTLDHILKTISKEDKPKAVKRKTQKTTKTAKTTSKQSAKKV
ncbi:MAG: hypothetical protein ACE5KZ_16030 [Candidatus Scalinduaceae bacterium]